MLLKKHTILPTTEEYDMSLESWMDEFYPVSREQDTLPASQTSDELLLKEALLKWTGALLENTVKHGVSYYQHDIVAPSEHNKSTSFLPFDYSTCRLCKKYTNNSPDIEISPELCGMSPDGATVILCPFFRIFGKRCDQPPNSFYVKSENNPQPMIKALKHLLTKV